MSKQTQGTMGVIGAIAGGIGVVAFAALMLVGGYAFSPALFLAAGIAVVVSIFLLFAFHRGPGLPAETLRAQNRAVTKPAVRETHEPAAASAHADAQPASTPAASHATTGTAPAAAVPESPTPEEIDAARSDPSREVDVGTKPSLMDSPRDGGPDDLKQIKGVGPKLEEMLHSMGVYHFDQIASWSGDEVAWVDENLEGFRGRVSRDDWVSQARVLSTGGETEFSQRVERGDVYQ